MTTTTTGGATRAGSATRTYKIDTAHSEAVFQVRHLVTKVCGRFDDFDGVVQINEVRPNTSSVEFTIRGVEHRHRRQRIATITCARPTSSTSRSFPRLPFAASGSSRRAARATT